MSVPDDCVGRRVQCPRCLQVFRFQGQRDLLLGRVRPAPTTPAPVAPPTPPQAMPLTAIPVAASLAVPTVSGKVITDDDIAALLGDDDVVEMPSVEAEPEVAPGAVVTDDDIAALLADEAPAAPPPTNGVTARIVSIEALPNLELPSNDVADIEEAEEVADVVDDLPMLDEAEPALVDEVLLDAELEDDAAIDVLASAEEHDEPSVVRKAPKTDPALDLAQLAPTEVPKLAVPVAAVAGAAPIAMAAPVAKPIAGAPLAQAVPVARKVAVAAPVARPIEKPKSDAP